MIGCTCQGHYHQPDGLNPDGCIHPSGCLCEQHPPTEQEIVQELARRRADTLIRARAMVVEHQQVIDRLTELAEAEPPGPVRGALFQAAANQLGLLRVDRRWLADLEARAADD